MDITRLETKIDTLTEEVQSLAQTIAVSNEKWQATIETVARHERLLYGNGEAGIKGQVALHHKALTWGGGAIALVLTGIITLLAAIIAQS